MKRIISLIMVLVLALSLVPTTVWATEVTPAADVAAVKNGSVMGTANSYYNIQNNGTATLENVTATAGNTDSSMIDN